MKPVAKVFTGLTILGVIVLSILYVAIKTLDPDKYRPQIVEVLGKQTGRTVKLGGPIKLDLAWHGLTLSMQDASIGNPAWASRPEMAGIGHFECGVSLWPLLSHKIVITEMNIVNADIQLETGASGKHNWQDMPSADNAVEQGAKIKATSSSGAVALTVDHLSITDSQLTMRDPDGKLITAKIKNMTFGLDGKGTLLHVVGEFNGAPLTVNMTMDTADIMANNAFPFDADVTYGAYHIKAQGKLNPANRTATLSSYNVTAGNSNLSGEMAVGWGDQRAIKGNVKSSHLNPADFKWLTQAPGSGGSVSNVSSKRLFSTDPLDVSGLKFIDADVNIDIDEFASGHEVLKPLTAKLDVHNGHLDFPIKAMVGSSAISGDMKLDATLSPPQMTLNFAAPDVDLGNLLRLAGVSEFLTGEGNVALNLGGSGNSLHDIASSASGTIDILAASGKVSASEAGSISSGLMNLFSPQGGPNALHCLAARFIALHGVVKDNGILVDTAASTISGKGNINLGSETIDMTLNAKTKLVNVGSLLPALHIGGSLINPSFGVDASGVAQGVLGIITSGGASITNVAGLTAPAGQNACVYNLDHPPAESASIYQSVTDQVQDKVKDVGGQIFKGLLGH